MSLLLKNGKFSWPVKLSITFSWKFGIKKPGLGYAVTEVITMSYISSEVQPKFNELSESLKSQILSRDVQVRTIHDLIRVLEEIVEEGEKN